MNFDQYFTNAEVETTIEEWADKFPHLITVTSIGNSHENRPIWLLSITNQKTGLDQEKPAVWIDANIHATEISGTTTALFVAHNLLSKYGEDEQVTRILDNSTYYIVPRVNPDGAELALAQNPRYIRSGVRPYPWEDKEEGLHIQDIDNDGRILQMRIEDPNGDWKISSLNPRLMEKRDLDEVDGTFYRLLPEGMLEDFDGYVVKIARPVQGLDFNRNFPFEWRAESEQSGAGPYPASEPEIRSMVDFIVNHPNINIAITFHTFSRVILRPYSTRPDDDMNTNDLWVFKKIGERGSQLTGYRCVSTFHDFKYHPKEVTTGVFDDWMYDHFGIFCYTIELWDLPTEAGIKDRKFIEWWREHPHIDDLLILKWVEENAAPESYIDWIPFEHPQLGKIEIGGWNSMYTWRNPPVSHIKKEAAKQSPYMLALGDMLPKLDFHTLEVTPLADGTFHLNLVVENSGFLPTYTSHQGKNRKAIRPVRVELDLPDGVELVSGKAKTEVGHLEGRSNKLGVSATSGASPTDNLARGEWVLRAPTGTKVGIIVLSERAGKLQRQIVLEMDS
jgi:murein tripeptide amidase MpaA